MELVRLVSQSTMIRSAPDGEYHLEVFNTRVRLRMGGDGTVRLRRCRDERTYELGQLEMKDLVEGLKTGNVMGVLRIFEGRRARREGHRAANDREDRGQPGLQ